MSLSPIIYIFSEISLLGGKRYYLRFTGTWKRRILAYDALPSLLKKYSWHLPAEWDCERKEGVISGEELAQRSHPIQWGLQPPAEDVGEPKESRLGKGVTAQPVSSQDFISRMRTGGPGKRPRTDPSSLGRRKFTRTRRRWKLCLILEHASAACLPGGIIHLAPLPGFAGKSTAGL